MKSLRNMILISLALIIAISNLNAQDSSSKEFISTTSYSSNSNSSEIDSTQLRYVRSDSTPVVISMARTMAIQLGMFIGPFLGWSKDDSLNRTKPTIIDFSLAIEIYPLRHIGFGGMYNTGWIENRDENLPFKGRGRYLAPFLSYRTDYDNSVGHTWSYVKFGIGYNWQEFTGDPRINEQNISRTILGEGLWSFINVGANFRFVTDRRSPVNIFGAFIDLGFAYIHNKNLRFEGSNEPVLALSNGESATYNMLGFTIRFGLTLFLF